MSCITNASLCGLQELVLLGPIAQPPQSGWRITSLPERLSNLQSAWASTPGIPQNSKAAWAMMHDFVRANDRLYPGFMTEMVELATTQWCSPEPWRCRDWSAKKFTAPDLPWAKDAWETANNAMANNLEPEDVKNTLDAVVATLTTLISSPTGCQRCYSHWLTHLETHPVPVNPTLDEARHWLVDIHNLTREGKTPTPFEEVKEKFSWL